MFNSRIIGLGKYLPDNVVTNDDLSKIMDTSNKWIVERTGINERRHILKGSDDSPSTMAFKASKIAKDTFEKSQINLDLPKVIIGDQNITLIEIVKMFNFCSTNGEVRRLVKGHGIKINDQTVNNDNLKFSKEKYQKPIKISVGKKKHGLLIFK